MVLRLVAIAIIFAGTAIAWMVLGGTILYRTYEADARLYEKVEDIWGEKHFQRPPEMFFPVTEKEEQVSWESGKRKVSLVEVIKNRPLPLEGSQIAVSFDLEHRQKGLLWYATYKVDFAGTYRYRNDSGREREIGVSFPFPADTAIYDDFRMILRERAWRETPKPKEGRVEGRFLLPAGEEAVLEVAYRSQGLESWVYRFGSDISQVRDFRLVMDTDFDAIDFPANTLSPLRKEKKGEGWKLTWEYENLLAGVNIGMVMPNRLQPGPLAGRISFFAPVSLFFFIVMTLAFALVRGVDIHPMHFFFLSGAFFAFHLLLAYLADHLSIHLSFAISSAVSLVLVASYLHAAIGRRFAYLYAAPIQFLYLVLFSYTFFFKGYTGLAITIGAVLSLFVMMQLTARVNWEEVFDGGARN